LGSGVGRRTGGTFRSSYGEGERDRSNSSDSAPQPHCLPAAERCASGGLQRIARQRANKWLRRYANGYFLLLARHAFCTHNVGSAFIQCWTIWEHLFAILNREWLLPKHARRLDSAEKIAFILTEFALFEEIDDKSRERICSLAEIRNTLVHTGRVPERTAVYDDAVLFIRLTEFVVAKTLHLQPSNLFNTVESLEKFLAGAPKSNLQRSGASSGG
jgi:hypothetical protein